jgi:hypothetical protein
MPRPVNSLRGTPNRSQTAEPLRRVRQTEAEDKLRDPPSGAPTLHADRRML